MAIQTTNLTISRKQVIQALAKIRHEWEDVAPGVSLLEISGNVGYLLFDIAVALRLSNREIRIALGGVADAMPEGRYKIKNARPAPARLRDS